MPVDCKTIKCDFDFSFVLLGISSFFFCSGNFPVSTNFIWRCFNKGFEPYLPLFSKWLGVYVDYLGANQKSQEVSFCH